ncbi:MULTISPECIES: hypothetical protein [unclassified Mesorhizobium]|uniref:hypothetical protein n=1 Tax=unclassified Mesorhizobium TaxID=325217 RepID=UPI0011281EF0|nr:MULTISPECIES: hypothetical protein [unclassified Mesorhizobium]MBZ9703247.1 hypothetical protein [Mesorhizobium sp. CO1-1-3]MBZ9947098.1 hypothetical protein [Mesorhizobium sp. BR1-1-11]TPJ06677.1 hypothetical protein FJ428_10715 [Mesorhizobium sp. B2-8-1]
MKSFKQFLRDANGLEGEMKEVDVFYHFATDDQVAKDTILKLLTEAIPFVDLGKGRSIVHHKAHVPNTEDHLHFVVNGNKFAAVNKSGTAHDRSHGIKLQNWALKGAAKHYPDFTMPKNGLIETLYGQSDNELLLESDRRPKVLLSRARRVLAELAVD